MASIPKTIDDLLRATIHLTEDEVEARARGVAPSEPGSYIDQHLALCVACQRDLEIARSVRAFELACGASTDKVGVPISRVPLVGPSIYAAIETLATLLEAIPSRVFECSSRICFEPVSPLAFGTHSVSMMGPGEERRYEASFPDAVKALGLPEQFDTLKVVLEDEGGPVAKLSLLLEPDLLAEELPTRIVEVRAEVRDRTGRLLARLPLALRPGVQNRSNPASVRLGSDPGEFEGTLSLVLCEVFPDVPFEDGE